MSDEIIKENVIKGLLHSISNRGNTLKNSIENFGTKGINGGNGANGFHDTEGVSGTVYSSNINGTDVNDIAKIDTSNTVDFQDSEDPIDFNKSVSLHQLDEIEIAQLHSAHHAFAEHFNDEAVKRWSSGSYLEDDSTQSTNAYSKHLLDCLGERIYLRIQLHKDNPSDIILVSVPVRICYNVYSINKTSKPLQEQWLASGSWQECKALFLLLFRSLFVAWPSNNIEHTALSLAKNTEKLNLWRDDLCITQVKQKFYIDGVYGYAYIEYPTELLKSWL